MKIGDLVIYDEYGCKEPMAGIIVWKVPVHTWDDANYQVLITTKSGETDYIWLLEEEIALLNDTHE